VEAAYQICVTMTSLNWYQNMQTTIYSITLLITTCSSHIILNGASLFLCYWCYAVWSKKWFNYNELEKSKL